VPVPEPRKYSQRTVLIVGLLAIVAAGGLLALLFRDSDGSATSPVRRGSFEVFELDGIPLAVAVSEDAVWVALSDQSVVKLDPEDGTELARTRVPFIPSQVMVAHGSVWVGAIEGTSIVRFPEGSIKQAEPIEVGTTPQSLAAGPDDVFVSAFDEGLVRRLDPETGAVGDVVYRSEEAFPSAMVAAFESLWIADVVQDFVIRSGPDGGENVTIPVGDSPTDLVAAFDSVWVANFNERTVSEVDPVSEEAGPAIAVGAKPGPMAAASGFLWVLRPGQDGFVVVDPEAGRWTGDVYEVGDAPQDIAAGLGSVWIVTQDSKLTRIPAP
jgi:streptogramin lyase